MGVNVRGWPPPAKDGFIFDPSLVLYLPLYELDGAKFQSKDAYGHLCTVTGALWRPNGRYFNGSTNKIEIPASAKQFDFTSEDFTIIAQIYPEDIAANRAYFDRGNYQVGGYYFYHGGDGKPRLATHQSLADQTSVCATAVVINKWQNVAVVRIGTAATFYIDGEAKNSSGALANPTSISVVSTIASLGTSAYFLGTIGYILVYSRALTPQEVLKNYLATRGRY